MKTGYVISPGLQLPGESFAWRGTPIILSQPAIWEAMRALPSGLIFRVRTEQNVGDTLNGADRIESCVGLIDTTSRWRACLAIIRTALSGLRIPDVAEASWNVFGMMTTKHQANVAMSERQQLATQLRIAIEKLPENDARAMYEAGVAAMMIRLAYAENDVEVAHIVPYSTIYMVNAGSHAEDREGTVEAMASNVVLAEAGHRMSEKAPEWLFGPLPMTPGVAPPAVPPEKPAKAQDEAADEDEA